MAKLTDVSVELLTGAGLTLVYACVSGKWMALKAIGASVMMVSEGLKKADLKRENWDVTGEPPSIPTHPTNMPYLHYYAPTEDEAERLLEHMKSVRPTYSWSKSAPLG